MQRRAFIVLVPALAWMLATFAPPAAHAQATSPEAVVDRFHAVLLDVMKAAKTLGHQGRAERLKPAIEQAFHLRVMIQIATGGAWRQASEAQKSALTAAFSALSTATYAANFDGHSGEKFETVGTRPGPQDTTLVDTKIVKASGTPVEITYVAKKAGSGWKIVDVVVDKGISELAVKRSEYAAVLKSSGVDGLVAVLKRKAEELAKN